MKKLNFVEILTNHLNDLSLIQFLCRGENMQGSFQWSKHGAIKIIKQLFPLLLPKALDKTLTVQEVISLGAIVNTIIRPSSKNSGATERIIAKANKKKGDFYAFKPTDYFYNIFKEITNETYEELIYQEQLMKLIMVIWNVNGGIADIYRRYFESSNDEKINFLKDEFRKLYAGKVSNADLHEFWNYLISVSGYSFNKSHSVAYTILSLITSWLTANKDNPNTLLPYMCINIDLSKADQKESRSEKIEKFINILKSNGVEVILPKINLTYKYSMPIQNKVVLPIDVVDGIGSVVKNRLAQAPKFDKIDDFLNWCSNQYTITKNEEGEHKTKIFNKAIYKTLIKINFFSSLTDMKINELVNYINNYFTSKYEFREMTYIKARKQYEYRCKNNAKFKEEIVETYPNNTCKVAVLKPLLEEKLCLKDFEGSYLSWEKELLKFQITNPLINYNHIKLEENQALIYIIDSFNGFKNNYHWCSLKVLWDKEHTSFPSNCFISNFSGNLEKNGIYKVDFEDRNGKINIEKYKIIDII